jgi:hypothetical protein
MSSKDMKKLGTQRKNVSILLKECVNMTIFEKRKFYREEYKNPVRKH